VAAFTTGLVMLVCGVEVEFVTLGDATMIGGATNNGA
jgi:hypothetical protein